MQRTDALLCSINDRLGVLARACGQDSGIDVPMLTDHWLDDLVAISQAEQLERARADGDVPEDMPDDEAMRMLHSVVF